MIFEPHNLYGERDPDGNAWPFGYISDDTTSNQVPLPIFELTAMFAGRRTLTETARLMAAADDLFAALKAVLTVWHDATATRQDDEAAEKAAHAAIAKVEGVKPPPKILPRRHWLIPGECAYCDAHRQDPMMPFHDASARCESGKHSHCSCDVCF